MLSILARKKIRITAFCLILFPAFAGHGCRRQPQEEEQAAPETGSSQAGSSQTGAPAAGPAAPAASPEEQDRKSMQAEVANARKFFEGSSSIESKLQRGKVVLALARMVAAKHKVEVAEIAQVEELIRKVEDEQTKKLGGVVGKVEKELLAVLNDPTPNPAKFDQARSLLAAKTQEVEKLSPSSEIRSRMADLVKRIDLYDVADRDFESRIGRINNYNDDHVRIIGNLAGFDPDFDETPYGRKVRSLIDEHYAHYLEEQEKKTVERKAKLDFKPVRLERATEVWGGPDNASQVPFKVDKGVLVLGPNPASYDGKNDYGTFVAIGEPAWIDVHITFQAQLSDPQSIFFGVKGYQDPDGRPHFNIIQLEGLDLDKAGAAGEAEAGAEKNGGSESGKDGESDAEGGKKTDGDKDGGGKDSGKEAGEEPEKEEENNLAGPQQQADGSDTPRKKKPAAKAAPERGRWFKFTVMVEGRQCQINCPELNWSVRQERLVSDRAGYFVLQVRGDRAKISVKDFQAAVLKEDDTLKKPAADAAGDKNAPKKGSGGAARKKKPTG